MTETEVQEVTTTQIRGASATYSPEDDKIRMSFPSRLDEETYQRVKAMGFQWAPKQGVFYAVWGPGRADLAEDLCGEIEDDDKSLLDRAEERADRFDDYRENRMAEGQTARAAVSRISDGIPMGQPILVGHHSEKRARKDAERIENGMRKAVKAFETADYWRMRAAGAIAHAKYRERPDVRARRIKTIESDLRKSLKETARADKYIDLWSQDGLTLKRALILSGNGETHISRCFPLAEFPRVPPASQYEERMSIWSALDGGVITAEQARDICIATFRDGNARRARWIEHYQNRLAYENAMLDEGGGLPADKFDIQLGGKIYAYGEWFVITRLNKSGEKLLSVSVTGGRHWCSTIEREQIRNYEPPKEGDAEKVKKATALLPIMNFHREGFLTMTMAEWKRAASRSDSYFVARFNAQGGEPKSGQIGEGPAVYRQRSAWRAGGMRRQPVFISDLGVKEPPQIVATPEKVKFDLPERELPPAREPYVAPPERAAADEMRRVLKGGVQVAVAPQLFPTPKDLARRMVQLAGGVGILAGRKVLEPSAGTGRLIEAAVNDATGFDCCRITAVELNAGLVHGLHQMRNRWLNANDSNFRIFQGDFLEQNVDELGTFDVVLMNPPFENGIDVKHIQHARSFISPGGVIVAICANGPRQRAALMDLAEHWEDLPAGTFAEAGTNVNTALLVVRG